MRIGSAWTKQTEKGEAYVSISLDEVVTEMCPMLKNCFINLWYVPKEERKNENSPTWSVNISVKKDLEKKKETAEDLDEDVPF